MMIFVRRGLLPLGSALIGALTQAAGSGYIVTSAFAQLVRREDEDVLPPLLVVRSNDAPKIARAGHSSHSSHSSHYSGGGGGGTSSGHSSHTSHRSHYSSSGGGGGGGWDTSADDDTVTTPAPVVRPDPPPPPPKPARVVIAAFPGGKIYIDGKPYGADATSTLTLKAGTYSVRVVNRFLGEHTASIQITDGQTGTVAIKW